MVGTWQEILTENSDSLSPPKELFILRESSQNKITAILSFVKRETYVVDYLVVVNSDGGESEAN